MEFYNLVEEKFSDMHHDVNSSKQDTVVATKPEQSKDYTDDYDLEALVSNRNKDLTKSLKSVLVEREVEKLLDEIVIAYIKSKVFRAREEAQVTFNPCKDSIFELRKMGFRVIYGNDVEWSNEDAVFKIKQHYRLVGLSNSQLIEECTSIIKKLESVFNANKDIFYERALKIKTHLNNVKEGLHYTVVATQIEEYLRLQGLSCDVVCEEENSILIVTWHW